MAHTFTRQQAYHMYVFAITDELVAIEEDTELAEFCAQIDPCFYGYSEPQDEPYTAAKTFDFSEQRFNDYLLGLRKLGVKSDDEVGLAKQQAWVDECEAKQWDPRFNAHRQQINYDLNTARKELRRMQRGIAEKQTIH